MDFLAGAMPSTVGVCGEEVPIRTGWRRAVRSYSLTGKGPGAFGDGDARRLLALWFARDGMVPDPVMAHPAEALEAALAWREEPMASAVPYGPGPGCSRDHGDARTFDLEADSAIVCADFLRLYGIDLAAWQGHWWRFCALLLPLAITEGSLVSTAIAARSPLPEGLHGGERRRRLKLQRAWALPVPESERVRLENERIAREW